MMPPVREATPGAASVAELFATAMQGDGTQPDTPPEVDRDAPHGRDPETGQPLAPYGWTKPQRKGDQPRPKMTAGGRPSKDEAARVTEIAPAAPAERKKSSAKKSAEPAADREADYSEGLAGAHDAVWAALTGASKIAGKIPVIGPRLPAEKVEALAYVWHVNQPQLCGAVALAAKHNDGAARFAARFASGGATWPIMCAAMIMPVAVSMAAVVSGDDRLAAMEAPSVAELAEMNARAMSAQVAEAMGKFQELAAERELAEEAVAA